MRCSSFYSINNTLFILMFLFKKYSFVYKNNNFNQTIENIFLIKKNAYKKVHLISWDRCGWWLEDSACVQVATHHAGCQLAALNPTDSDSTELSDLDTETGPILANSRLGPGSLFRLRFLGSVDIDEEERSSAKRRLKKTMVEEAVLKIKVGRNFLVYTSVTAQFYSTNFCFLAPCSMVIRIQYLSIEHRFVQIFFAILFCKHNAMIGKITIENQIRCY